MNKQFINPFSDEFMELWELWKEYRREEHQFKYKSIITEQAAAANLTFLSGNDEDTAIAIIKQSMANGWRGFFALKTIKLNQNGTKSEKQSASSTATRESLNDLYNQRFGQTR